MKRKTKKLKQTEISQDIIGISMLYYVPGYGSTFGAGFCDGRPKMDNRDLVLVGFVEFSFSFFSVSSLSCLSSLAEAVANSRDCWASFTPSRI